MEPSENAERELVESARGGSREAFAALVAAHKDRVYSFALRMTGDAHVSEDLAQDVFVRALSSLGTLNDPAKFRPWLFAIAANHCRNWLKRHRREAASTESLAAGDGGEACEHAEPDPAASPVWAADLAERRRLVQAALAGLPVLYREAAVLRFQEEMKVSEVAQALNVSVAAAESRLRRAKALLRARLAHLAQEGGRP